MVAKAYLGLLARVVLLALAMFVNPLGSAMVWDSFVLAMIVSLAMILDSLGYSV